jgi:PAS domain S-box-containing protein
MKLAHSAASIAQSDGKSAEAETLQIVTSLVADLADAAIVLDANFECVSASRPFGELSGMRAKALERAFSRGSSLFSLFESLDIAPEALTSCFRRATRTCLLDVEGKSHNGDEFVVIATLIPIQMPTGGTIGIACIMRDVTAEVGLQLNYKSLLAAEQKRAEQLEDTVLRRTIDLQKVLDEVTAQAAALEESNSRELALQKFVFAGRLATGLAHEFNSPLACVLANQSYLRSRMEGLTANMLVAPPEFVSFLEEAIEILDEDAGSMKRLSATVGALQGSFCQTPNSSEEGIIATDVNDILLDTQRALSGEGVCAEHVTFTFGPTGKILAHAADVSLALVTLVQFLRNHEAAPESQETGGMPNLASTVGKRSVKVTMILDGIGCIISLASAELHISVDEAEAAFDPSLVVSDGNRVKLSVDLSVCAARIARSGGSVQFATEEAGTVIEVHLMQANDEPAKED